ncbi:MAG: OmpA family protein [Muribaculaceae bacterium]|nr:OmpA family protein [Muribaculaceae bacterium]
MLALGTAPWLLSNGQDTMPAGVSQELPAEEMTIEQTLAVPEVPSKLNAFVKGYMKREALALLKAGYKVETMRKGEIVIATIPTDKLFEPNDTALSKSAASLLKPFLPYFRVPGKFKVILALHTDDSGSDTYLSSLSEKRIVSLYDYFDSNASDTESLTGYPMAANEPLKDNNSRSNRAENRRLEIYIVPDKVLIEEMKKSK